MRRNALGVFAGGDMISSQRNVSAAIGLGKKAARNIDAFLRSEKYTPKAKAEIADVKKMNTSEFHLVLLQVPTDGEFRMYSGSTTEAEMIAGLNARGALFMQSLGICWPT